MPPTVATKPTLRVVLPVLELPAADAQLAQAVDAAAQSAGVAITRQSLSEADLRATLAAASTEAPDLALLDRLAVARLRRSRALQTVDPIVDDAIGLNGPVPDNVAMLLQAGDRRDLRWYGVPFLSRGVAWLVRRDLLAERGVTPPRTYAEVIAAAVRLADPAAKRAGLALPFLPDEWGESLAEHLLLAFGAALTDATGQRVALNSTEAVEAARFVAGLRAEPWLWRGAAMAAEMAPSDAPPIRERLANDFLAGTLALVPPSPGLYARLVADSAGRREDTLALPLPAGPKRHTTSGPSYHFVVPAKAPIESIATFLRRLLRPEPLREIILHGVGELVPTYAYLTKDAFWDEDPNYQVLALGTRGASLPGIVVVEPGYPGPPRPEAAEAARRHILSRLFRRVLAGVAPEDAVGQAHAEAEEAFRMA